MVVNSARYYFVKKVTFAKWKFDLVVMAGFILGFACGVWTSLEGAKVIFADDSGSGYYEWQFGSSGDYSLSSSSLLEVASNKARFKVRNYESDANTKLLMHFDEASGTTLDDVSANNNDSTLILPTPTPATIWTAGKLDGNNGALGGLKLDGASMYTAVADTADAVTLTQNQTLEAWVKFNNTFSTTSHATKQVIFDKGEYQLYFNQQTGKLVYELAPNTTNTWAQKAGNEIGLSWDSDGKTSVSAINKSNSYLYVATGAGAGDAEVWRWDGTSDWTWVGGNGIKSSWNDNTYDDVQEMETYGDDVIVGTGNADGDADLWYFDADGDSGAGLWTQIGGDSGGTSAGYSWNTGINMITALEVMDGVIYVGTGNGAGEGDLWSCDLSTGCTKTSGWTQIGGDSGGTAAGYSWNANYDQVWSVHFIGTRIHVGLGNTAGEAELWVCDTATGCTKTTGWTQIGGDGLLGSWAAATYEAVMTIRSYVDTNSDTQMVVGLGVSAGDAEIWRCNYTDTTNCTGVNAWGGTALVDGNTGSGTAPQSWNNAFERVWSIAIDDQVDTDYLYVGLGDSSGDGEVWRCDLAGTCNNTAGWTKLGGDGNNSSWTGAYYYARKLFLDGSTLYVGTYGTTGYGELWRYNGSWARIGGQYIYGGWGYNGLDRIMSMTAGGGKLYAGSGSAAGDSTVWEYDGTTWSMIGGQQTNSSWTYNTIETVEALAPYKGDLYAGLGTTTDDGQVWKYNGTVWAKIGGNGATQTGSWADADNIEAVYSLAADNTKLYAGLGNSTDDGKIFAYDGTTDTWTQIAGRKTVPLASGWQDADNIETVYSMISDGDYLYAGLGYTADDADVWRYDKLAGTWSQLANAGATSAPSNGSWYNIHDIEGVYSMEIYNGELYAGLGASTGDAKVYKYDGSNWTLIGGLGSDSGYGSWDADFELVRNMSVYNGYLFAALGNSDSDAEVWRWDGSSWTRVGGDSENSSWLVSDYFNTSYGMTVYKGKLYTGTGDGSQTETTVWAYGDNAYVESDSAITDTTNWHHYAATYDGTTARMYIDGAVQTNTDTQTLTLENSSRNLLVGTSYGGFRTDTGRGFLDGQLDEIRISNSVRSAAEMVENTYSSTATTVRPTAARMTSQIDAWTGFSVTEGVVGDYGYCLSSDGGSTWKYLVDTTWTTTDCDSLSNSSSESAVNSNIASFPVNSSGITWKAVLSGDGTEQSEISEVRIEGTPDTSDPEVPANVAMQKDDDLGVLVTGGTSNWYDHTQVYVHWDASKDDTDGSGDDVGIYHVYFGTESTADPLQAGEEVATNSFTKTFTAGTAATYYLMIQAEDNAGNISDSSTQIVYQFDDEAPTAPRSLTVSPAAYATENEFTFTWTAPVEGNVRGYQYKVNDGEWSGEFSALTLTLTDVAADGENTLYLVAIDNAGNTGAEATKVFYLAGAGPTAPTNLAVDETPKSENLFTFTWDPPETYLGGDPTKVKYCYTINEEPSADTCTNSNTLTGVETLGPGEYATQRVNTLYVIAKNPDSYGGSVNYAGEAWATVEFEANTTAPGMPTNVEIADISIKSTSNWRLTVSWAAPSTGADVVYDYWVYQSIDGTDFGNDPVGTTTGTAYVLTGLTQVPYYYKIRACDKAGSCSAYTTAVSETPTGRFTEAATLTSGPTTSGITTKKATISWSTDRTCDSRVQYGISSGSYYTEEPSNSTHVTDHSIALSNLSPGTTYYYRTKWTDEDGNTGTSSEKTFATSAAPTAKDVSAKSVGLDSAILQFTTTGSSKVKVYYGQTTGFGFVKEISTETTESTYTVTLEELDDGTKYYYKINVFDSESAEYDGTILNFTTLPRPKISTVRVQEITGTAQPTVLVTWETNTEISSIITYYPVGDAAAAKDEVNVALKSGAHRMILRGLMAQKDYVMTVKGRDKAGNEASSEQQKFTTSTDTRPPQIMDLSVEGSNVSIAGGNGEQTSQLVVTWNTDEPSTSQVEFGEGTGSTYAQKTQEDASLTSNHLVVISGLVPSKVYHLRAVSKDKAANSGSSVDTVSITPKATDNAFNLVISNLSEAFGFIGALTK